MRTFFKWTIFALVMILSEVCLFLTFTLGRLIIEAYRHQQAVQRAVKIIDRR